MRHEAPAWIGIRVSLAIGKVAALQDCFQRAALTVFGPDGPDPFSFCRHSLAFSGLPQSWYSITIPCPACASSALPSAGIVAFRSIIF